MGNTAYFGSSADAARLVLAEVLRAVAQWRINALSPAVGLCQGESQDFAPAFEHEAVEAGRRVVGLGNEACGVCRHRVIAYVCKLRWVSVGDC